jgi:hypothetical protein
MLGEALTMSEKIPNVMAKRLTQAMTRLKVTGPAAVSNAS